MPKTIEGVLTAIVNWKRVTRFFAAAPTASFLC